MSKQIFHAKNAKKYQVRKDLLVVNQSFAVFAIILRPLREALN